MFNEKKEEYSAKQGKSIPVWISPKYEEAKKKAIELIESKKYDLTEGDFWILMNETKTGKMGYSGLIISHNGCLKINDKLDNKFNTNNVTLDKDGYANSLVYTYTDEDVFEIGEVNSKNCKNDYPYAMAFKRCFDRVVLKKSKLAYAGVYSDSEADEFTGKDIETTKKQEEKEIEEIDINAKVGFGKYKDNTWLELYSQNSNYFDWLIDNAKSPDGAETYKKIKEEIENSFINIEVE